MLFVCFFLGPALQDIVTTSFRERHGGQDHQLDNHQFAEAGEATAGSTCSVCICDFASEDMVRRLPCGHVFHTGCVDPWLQQRATCPTCRWSMVAAGDASSPEESPGNRRAAGEAAAAAPGPVTADAGSSATVATARSGLRLLLR
mmetsp:Transcript_9622/g.23126  ORF Transcript_9622/g.23126 Transcript_9622/m.23126 type:complete len:145 (-) Transcript_9622:60-494(-)